VNATAGQSHADREDRDHALRPAGPARTPEGRAGAARPPADLAVLQRTAGNRAVARLLASRAPRAGEAREPVTQDVDRTSQTVTGRSTHWGATERSARPATLFGRDATTSRAGGRARPGRYSTTDSTIANIASVFGAGAGASAATSMGAVTFDTSAYSAAVPAPLVISKTATDVTVGSGTFATTGTVKASGPAARVGSYELGWAQTVYESSRNFYYEPVGHTPGFLAGLAPSIFGQRKRVSDTLTTLPVRDGITAGVVPWYDIIDVKSFDALATSTKTTATDDTPSSPQPWTIAATPGPQVLKKTDGRDAFRNWLVVKDKASAQVIPLHWSDWHVDYGTTVAFNSASPAASVVTPTATGGAKVTATGDGSGGKWPILVDPIANTVTTVVQSSW